ncbi:MAG: YraN family protein [Cyclobacteriaceae bacterium]
MDNQLLGKYGEDLAVSFLEKHGFEVIERNYRYKRNEIDLIGILNQRLLVFFEVKNRKNNRFGEPESFVSDKQQQRIKEAAEEYIYGINWMKDIRFDILTILDGHVTHFEDAF